MHSSLVSWQRPFRAHSSVFSATQRCEDVTESASPDSARAAVATPESELLQAMVLEAPETAPDGHISAGQGVPHDNNAHMDFEGLSMGQQGLEKRAQMLHQKPAETINEASASAMLTEFCTEDTRQPPASFAAGSALSMIEADCAEEMGPAQFWQAAVAEAEISSQAQCCDTAYGVAGASACLETADLNAAEHATKASTEMPADMPCSACRAESEHTAIPDSAKACLQQEIVDALHGVKTDACSTLSEEALMCVVPHHGSGLGVSEMGDIEVQPASRANTCGSSPTHAAGIGAASTPGSCSTRHHSRSRTIPRARLSRRRRSMQKPRPLPSMQDHDADILAALLALQMAVSDHSAAILQLRHASQPQSCCSLPNSPTQLRGLLTAHLDVAWSGQGSQDASSGSPSHGITSALPDSKAKAGKGALAVETEQGLPHQPSLAVATDGSDCSIKSAGRPSQAEQLQLRHAAEVVPRRLPTAAAGARRTPPSTLSSSLRPEERPGMQCSARHDPLPFNIVLQGWHKQRRLEAGASRK